MKDIGAPEVSPFSENTQQGPIEFKKPPGWKEAIQNCLLQLLRPKYPPCICLYRKINKAGQLAFNGQLKWDMKAKIGQAFC
ncbi:hypothetical protein VTN96DRAFT_2697 [Rasamsonia emersonii]